jgi:hypothetical protein
MYILLFALTVFGCVNCAPTNTTTVVGTNNFVLGAAVISNGILVVNAPIPSNQVDAVSTAIGTNNTPSQLNLNPQ